MLITIKLESETPIYQQLRDQIVGGIASGELKQGDSLPSVRELARDIGVNYHTVNKAYSLLREEGYVKIFGRKGAVVAEPPEADEAFIRDIKEKLLKIIAEAKSKGLNPGEIMRYTAEMVKATEFEDISFVNGAGKGGESNE